MSVIEAPVSVIEAPRPLGSVIGGQASAVVLAGQPELFPPLGDPGADGDLSTWLRHFTLSVIEVLTARRSSKNLAAWMTAPVQRSIQEAVRARARVELVSVRGQRTDPVSVEASAHLRIGERSVAAAFRMSRTSERWICTVWQMRVEDLRRARAC